MALNLKKLMFAALPLLLPACAQDEPGEGRMPMEFTVSLADESPQSRVSESDDGSKSVWTEGDKITVNVTQGGSTQTATSQTATCTLGSDGNVKEYSKTLYWESRESATVSASYSNLGANNSIADQSRGLAYVLRADASTTYGNTIGLTFRHQFAKVRIKFEGSKASEVTDVKINNYTQCTVATDGKVTGSSGTEGYIITRKNGDYYEANVCPVTSLPDNFIDAGEDFKVSVTGISKLEAGKVYTITINAKEALKSEITVMGHQAVLMREASGTPGNADYVPVLYFATTNIGADNPEDTGKYFWWGDTQGHTSGESFNFTKDNTEISTLHIIFQQLNERGIFTTDDVSTAVFTKAYDAAAVQWGSDWRMPTYKELSWLANQGGRESWNNCTWQWQDAAGDKCAGYLVTSNSTGNSIFLPVAGTIGDENGGDKNNSGAYWVSNLAMSDINDENIEDPQSTNAIYASKLKVTSKLKGMYSRTNRWHGYSIRPVITR